VAAARVNQPEYVWTMVKQEWQIDCVVEDEGPARCAVRVLLNGQWFFRTHFTSRAQAVKSAEAKYDELWNDGWKPVVISTTAE